MLPVTKGAQVSVGEPGWSVLGPGPAIGLSVVHPGKAELGTYSGTWGMWKGADKGTGDYSSVIDRN